MLLNAGRSHELLTGGGALKLDLGKQGEPAVLLVLEGIDAEGTATGHFSGEETGAFKLTRKTKESSLPPYRPE